MLGIRVILSWYWFGVRIWWWRLRHSANTRAFILERDGLYYELFLGVRTTVDKKGETYEYGDTVILVPDTHPWETYEDERLLGVTDGQLVATPFMGNGTQLEASVISQLCRGNVARQYAESYTIANRSPFNLRLFLIIAAIAVILFCIYKFVLHGHIPGITPAVTPTPTPTPTPGPIYTLYSWVVWGASWL